MELLNLGASLAVIMKTDGWKSAAFRAYLQFRPTEESDVRDILLHIGNLAHSESEDEPGDAAPFPLTNRGLRPRPLIQQLRRLPSREQ